MRTPDLNSRRAIKLRGVFLVNGLSCRCQRVFPAVFEIRFFMACNQLHYADPQPGGSVEVFGPIAPQARHPRFPCAFVHLPRMRFSHHAGKKTCGCNNLVTSEAIHLQLKILRK